MSMLLDAIREAIENGEATPAQVARDAGIAKSQLSRLLSGERGLSVETAERLAACLGLEIVVRMKRRTTRGRK